MPRGAGLEQDLYQADRVNVFKINNCFIRIFIRVMARSAQLASGFPNIRRCCVRLSEKGARSGLDEPMKRSTWPVVLENDRAKAMFNDAHCRARGQGLERLDERQCSVVDKSRQGSHSLNNANVCEMFHGALLESPDRSYQPPGWEGCRSVLRCKRCSQ